MQAEWSEDAYLLALLKARPEGRSWGEIASSVAFEGSARVVFQSARDDALFALAPADEELGEAQIELNSWRDRGLDFMSVLDDRYPSRLLDIRETPPFLFVEGGWLHNEQGMSVVGSRSASTEGSELAAAIASYLVSIDLTVIAGLAAGIDAASHKSALEAGGRTVAVIGNGIAQSYPKENARLQREIAKRGLVISQFYPDASPTKFNFPMRNAVMSGYGLATIVVEAGEHSGTRIQARLAREHGRPVILTSRVARQTSWGRALAGEPGVYVVATMGEMKEAIQSVRSAPSLLDNALLEFAST